MNSRLVRRRNSIDKIIRNEMKLFFAILASLYLFGANAQTPYMPPIAPPPPAPATLSIDFDSAQLISSSNFGMITKRYDGFTTNGYAEILQSNNNKYMVLSTPAAAQFVPGSFLKTNSFSINANTKLGFDILNFPSRSNFQTVITFSDNLGYSSTFDIPIPGSPTFNKSIDVSYSVLVNGFTHIEADLSKYKSSTSATVDFNLTGMGDGVVSLDNIFVSAVPEPETYAMLLVGLCLIGAAVKCRKDKGDLGENRSPTSKPVFSLQ